MNKLSFFIGVDIGTQSVKTVLCDANKNVVSKCSLNSKLVINDNEIYENVDDIFSNVIESIKFVVKDSKVDLADIKAIGLDSQMAGIMAIDEYFNPVGPYDSWMDNRCSKYTQMLIDKLGDRYLLNSGCQFMHAHASKILWRKYEKSEEYSRISKFLQLSSYCAGKFAGLKSKDAFVDSTYIHFNCFSNIKNLTFDKNLLNELDIDFDKMPKIVNPDTVIGNLTSEFANILGLTTQTKIIAGCGDTAASSLGAGITKENLAYDVAGTASVFACASKSFVPDIKNHTMLYSRSVVDGLFLPLAYVSGGGLCLKWFSNLSNTSFEEFENLFKKQKNISINDIIFIPHMNGRSFPLDDGLSGAFLNLKSNTNKEEMYKAIMESITFEYRIYYDILLDSNGINNLDCIYGVGGGALSPMFCQIKADVLGTKYVALKNVDSAPVAVALIAAKATGYLNKGYDDIFSKDNVECEVYYPDANKNSLYMKKYQKYKEIVNNYSKFIN